MARVEDGSEPYPSLKRLHHNAVHFIVDYVSYLSEVHGVDHLVVAIVFVPVKILCLSPVSFRYKSVVVILGEKVWRANTRVMEK